MNSSSLHQVGTVSGASTLRRLATILRERAWLIFLCTLAGGALATAYVWKAPRIYAAQSVVSFPIDVTRLAALRNDLQVGTETSFVLDKKQAERTLSDPEFLRRVVDSQQLDAVERFAGKTRGDVGKARAVAALQRITAVENPDNDVIIRLTVRDLEPGVAARLANALADELIAHNARERDRMIGAARNALEQMLQRVQEELNTEPTASATAAQATPTTPPVATVPPAVNVQLNTVNQRLVAAGLKALELANAAKDIELQATNLAAAVRIPYLAAQPEIITLNHLAVQKQQAFDDVKLRYKAKHTNFITAEREFEAARAQLDQKVQEIAGKLRSELQSARLQEGELHAEYERLSQQARALPPPAAPVESPAPRRPSSLVQELHDQILERLQELKLAGTLMVTPIEIKTRATAPVFPEGLDPVRSVGVGLGAGWVLGLLICLGFGLGDTSIRSVDETESLLDLPVLSVLPRLKDNDSEMAAAEGFRSLRTSITVNSKGKDPRIVMFTSTSPDEGKTFCALNFAVGLAQQGSKTVLLECDLRRPMAAPSLTLVKVDAPGVSDFLKSVPPKPEPGAGGPGRSSGPALSFAEIRRKKTDGGEEEKPTLGEGTAAPQGMVAEAIVQRTEVANLSFVAAGTPVANPTELLARPRFEQLLNELLQKYDKIVLDSAPVLGVSETLLLANRTQGVCFVLRAGQTPRRAVIRAVEILRRANAPMLGVVINGLTPRRSDPYGQDYYYHRTTGRET